MSLTITPLCSMAILPLLWAVNNCGMDALLVFLSKYKRNTSSSWADESLFLPEFKRPVGEGGKVIKGGLVGEELIGGIIEGVLRWGIGGGVLTGGVV